MAWSCRNDRFETNTNKGHPHGPGNPNGSLFREPLYGVPGKDYTLWVEHVSEHNKPEWSGFWMMWYSPYGKPTIPGGAVFSDCDLYELMTRLTDFRQFL